MIPPDRYDDDVTAYRSFKANEGEQIVELFEMYKYAVESNTTTMHMYVMIITTIIIAIFTIAIIIIIITSTATTTTTTADYALLFVRFRV